MPIDALLLLLGALTLFLLGCGTAIYLFVRLVQWLARGGSSRPAPVIYPAAVQRPRPPDSRAEHLEWARREIEAASAPGQLDSATRAKVLEYLDAQLRLVRTAVQTAPAPAAVPRAVVPVPGDLAHAVPAAPKAFPRQFDPAEVRATIARLHAHAQAPVSEALAPPPAQAPAEVLRPEPLALPEAAPVPTAPLAAGVPAVKSASAALATEATSAQPTPEPKSAHPAADRVVPAQVVTSKSLAERLFTPENVRILQSLGIGLIFISAAAFVHAKMWADASVGMRMALLLGGTFCCLGVGYALQRWTGLRITGLAFVVLGHLALVLDALAALTPPNVGADPLYPFAPASLWCVAFAAFAASAAFHAWRLGEPLFDAFAVFGALAAWGSGMRWLGVSGWLLPAAYLPALYLARGAGALWPTEGPPARWTLPWWLRQTGQSGQVLLAGILPVAALASGRAELRADFAFHAAALVALGGGLLWEAWRERRGLLVQAGALLLLLPFPMAMYAFEWPGLSWAPAFALPGAGLVLIALAAGWWTRAGRERDREFVLPLAAWGLTFTGIGALWAIYARFQDPATAGAAAWSAGALLAAGLAFSLFKGSSFGPWLALAGAAFLTQAGLDLTGSGNDWLPGAWIVLALAAHLVCSSRPASACQRQGQTAADVLAGLAAAVRLFLLVHWLGPVDTLALIYRPLPDSVAVPAWVGWAALAPYVLLTSLYLRRPLRRAAGTALFGIALSSGLNTFVGEGFGNPSLWLGVAGLLTLLGMEVLDRFERREDLWRSSAAGTGVLVLRGLLMAAYQAWNAEYAAAGVSLAVLAVLSGALAVRLRMRGVRAGWCVCAETAGLALLAASAASLFAAHGVMQTDWPWLLPLLAGGVLLLAQAGEFFAAKTRPELPPLRRAGELVALVLSAIHFLPTLGGQAGSQGAALVACWAAALPALFVWQREAWRTRGDAWALAASPCAAAGAVLAAASGILGAWLALMAAFWLPGCAEDVRMQCAVFFGVALAVALVSGIRLRSAFAPAVGLLATVGLLGCGYGQWQWPAHSFGVWCAALSLWGVLFAGWLGRERAETRGAQARVLTLSVIVLAVFTAMFLLYGMVVWPLGHEHSSGVLAWGMLAACAWFAPALVNWRAGPAFLAGLALLAMGGHALRWAGLSFSQFGPGLAGMGLLLLGLRSYAAYVEEPGHAAVGPLGRRAPGLLVAALVAAALGLFWAFVGGVAGHPWYCGATLAEDAFFLAALATLVRGARLRGAGALLLCAELGAFALLALALPVGVDASGYGFLLHGAGWALAGALFLMIGMVGESVAGAALGPSSQAQAPGAFLESRHLAALALGSFGLAGALLGTSANAKPWLDENWRALFAAAALAAYGSLARWSVHEGLTRAGRAASALAAYVVLIPAGYLCLLAAHSTGSSWGALWFVALAPALLGMAWLLARQRQPDQARLAQVGAAVVSAGALVLAFASNHERLAAVPCATLAALALEAGLVRVWSGRREWTVAGLVCAAGAVFFGLRHLAGDPAWGAPEPWVWEWPGLTALGLLLTAAGGGLGLEKDAHGRSVVGQFGVTLAAATAPVLLTALVLHGPEAAYHGGGNSERLDAFLVGLLLNAGAAVAAWRWLDLKAGRGLAAAETFLAYGLWIWKWHVTAWEWYALPLALLLFVWAWQAAREERAERSKERGEDRDKRGAQGSNLLLGLASACLVVPSFLQGLPHTVEAAWHFGALLALALALVAGAMGAHRKVPLLTGSAALLLGTLIKAAQWAAYREVLLPVAGIGAGFLILAVGCFFESHMNRALRTAVDRARAEARVFWTSWD